MIASLRGILAETHADYVIIDVGGVGYRAFVSQSTMRALPAIGQEVTLRIHTHLREDALYLYGFALPAEKEAFHLLTAISGVGPRLALAVLSALSPSQLYRAVVAQDTRALTKVPGIGRKTAERILLELKDKMKADPGGEGGVAGGLGDIAVSEPASEAVAALIALGYGSPEAEQAVRAALAGSSEAGKAADTATLLRAALRQLAAPA